MIRHSIAVGLAVLAVGIIGCRRTEDSSGPLQTLPLPVISAIQASSCELDTARRRDSDWDLWRNCALTATFNAEAVDEAHGGVTACALLARGSQCQGAWPLIEISIDGMKIGSVRITSAEWAWFIVPMKKRSVSGELRLAFVNDRLFKDEDINVSIRKIALLGAE